MNKPQPGVSRDQRISAAGLQRLEQQLATGAAMQPVVLAQWIRRYGEPARELMRRYGIEIAAATDLTDADA